MIKAHFRHASQVRVRNYEVDWQGIVHNANYLLYFEIARIEYLRNLGVRIDMQSIKGASRVVVVRNEVNYRSSAKFDDLLDISTRVSYINETSFAFEGFMVEHSSGTLVAENVSVHVWLDSLSGAPMRVGEEFRAAVRRFEGETVAIRGPLP